MNHPHCVDCGRPLSPAAAGPHCGGIVSQIHVGLTKNGITCRGTDPDWNPPSTWQQGKLGVKDWERMRKEQLKR